MTAFAAENVILANSNRTEPRPHIHNTAGRLIKALGANVKCIIINNCHNKIFYSYIRLVKDGKTWDVDSKPSDSMAIALRSNAPIFVKKCVYEKAGIKITKELLERSTSV